MVADVVRKYKLFPAYAGVIPAVHPELRGYAAFPRICGGDPKFRGDVVSPCFFSPHMRG